MNTKTSFLIKASPLLLVLFIDGMGLGLVMPILNGLIFDPHSTFLAASINKPALHNLIYGGIISIFMLCWFFGAAFLGDLSDHIGRKKALLICLVGACLGNLLSALAIIWHSLTWLIIGRVIAGFTSGSQPIAQAAIVDLSSDDTKVRNIGYILFAMSLGFVLGPLIGGVLANNQLVAWFSFAMPFYFATFISFINIVLLLILFKETFITSGNMPPLNPYHAIDIFISAFRNLKVRNLSILFFIFIFGWSIFYSFIGIFLIKLYQFTPTTFGLFMALLGVGFGIANGFLVDHCSRLFPLRNNVLYSILLAAIIILFMAIFQHALVSWILAIPLACCVSVAYASILALFSNQVDANSQGWIMGISGSIMALVWAINAIIVGAIAALNASLPIFIASFSLFIAIALGPVALKH